MKLKENKREYRIRAHKYLSSIGFKDKNERDKILDRAPETVKHKIDKGLGGKSQHEAYMCAKEWVNSSSIKY